MELSDAVDSIHTLEISEPSLENNGVRFLTVYSPALQGRADVSVFVPSGVNRGDSIPVVILLHGVYGSHWAWFFRGGAHRTAENLISTGRMRPMLLVAPSDGLFEDGSGYVAHSGRDYDAWIADDVPRALRRAFPDLRCSDVFIAGLSMGGYGALRLGAKYPDRFRGISAHSPITRLEEMDKFVFSPFPAASIDSREGDILYWLDCHRDRLPRLRLDCGNDDPLIEANRTLHHELTQRGIEHDYFEFEGDHSWSYWSLHIADSLLYFERILST